MNVTRVHTQDGSHVEPGYRWYWSDAKKLDWHASITAADTGLTITIESRADHGRQRYAAGVGHGRDRWITSGDYTFDQMWDWLNGVSVGVRAAKRKTDQERA